MIEWYTVNSRFRKAIDQVSKFSDKKSIQRFFGNYPRDRWAFCIRFHAIFAQNVQFRQYFTWCHVKRSFWWNCSIAPRWIGIKNNWNVSNDNIHKTKLFRVFCNFWENFGFQHGLNIFHVACLMWTYCIFVHVPYWIAIWKCSMGCKTFPE